MSAGLRPLLLVAGLLLAAAPALACQPESEPETAVALDTRTPLCLAGAATPEDQDLARLTLGSEAGGLWTLTAEGLPGQGLAAAVITEDASGTQTPLWKGDGAPLAVSPPLFLAPGDYLLGVAAAGQPLVYRLRLEPGPPLPAALPAAAEGSFSGLATGQDAEAGLDWTPGQTAPGRLWTFTAQPPLGSSASLTLLDESGTAIVTSDAADGAGVVRLPDLALGAGRYRLSLGSLAAGQTILSGATAEERPPSFAAEPDGAAALAKAMTPGQGSSGHLSGGGLFEEWDYFALTIPPEQGTRLIDAVLTGPAGAPLTLSLRDEADEAVAERTGSGEVALRGLALPPGRHLFRVAGKLPPDATYGLRLEAVGDPPGDQEIEPNDTAAAAIPAPAGGSLAGSFGEADLDYIDLGVEGGLQLWDFQVTGEGLARMTLYDGAGDRIVEAVPETATPLMRLSRFLLPPGHNLVRLEGSGGRWLLRARPLGPPVAGLEVEPNDEETRATTLALGRTQSGALDRPGDTDVYAFKLAAEHHVVIELTAPPDLPVKLTLGWGGWQNRLLQTASEGAPGAPQRLVWDGMLPPGDFLLSLAAPAGFHRDPYALTVRTAPFFLRPADREPNDAAWQAGPAENPLAGHLHDGDDDWFRLPAELTGRTITAQEVPSGGISVALYRGEALLGEASLYAPGEVVTIPEAVGEGLLLQVYGNAGDYRLALDGPPVAAAAAPPLDAALLLDADAVAAYEPRGQRVTGRLVLHSRAATDLALAPRSWVGDERWRLAGLPDSIVVPAGRRAEVPVTLEVAPDAWDGQPVEVEVALGGDQPVVARAALAVLPEGPAVAPFRGAALPEPLAGGLDLAWTALGGSVDPANAGLIDGIVDAAGVTLSPGSDPVIDLAGDAALPVAGVSFLLPPGAAPGDRLAEAAVELSADGVTFERALQVRLSPQLREQAFALPAPVPAVAARLVPLAAQAGPDVAAMALAEVKVIAAPGVSLGDMDLMARPLGGHLVWHRGFGRQMLTGEAAAWPGQDHVAVADPREGEVSWALGFLNGRAARIDRLEWQAWPDVAPEAQMRVVEVSASSAGPLGPWTPLGRWDVAAAPGFALPEPVWARALAFRLVEPADGIATMPQGIAVHEAPGPSILGEWGDMGRDGPFEAAAPPPAEEAALPPVGKAPAEATPLPLGAEAWGRVRRGAGEDWYALELPAETRLLRVRFPEAPEAALTLVDAAGAERALVPDPRQPRELVAAAGPGRWLLRVAQPPQSIVVAWDTSISVARFFKTIVRLVQQLAWELRPEREAVNLVPFRGEDSRLLLPEWTGEPGAVYGALHAYSWYDTSSDAETPLLVAAQALQQRVGARAVVIITDASFDSVYQNEPLWQALDAGRIRVFALHLPGTVEAAAARAQADLLQDWAGANGGFYARFASQGESETTFSRLTAWLARPAGYRFVALADTTPPPPGRLSVQLEESAAGAADAAAGRSVELVLDASGSMLSRMGGKRRIDAAKEVLAELGGSLLPEGTTLALRAFGHRRGLGCKSELVLPPAPLERAGFLAAVGKLTAISNAKTALAEAIRNAGADLAATEGSRLIVLVTDGDETCGGDPAAEVAALAAQGIDVRLNVVGFAVAEAGLREKLEAWAAAGGGAYFDAADQAALAAALHGAVGRPLAVYDAAGAEVARGLVGGAPLELPAGRYRVRIGEAEYEAEVPPGEEIVLTVAPG